MSTLQDVINLMGAYMAKKNAELVKCIDVKIELPNGTIICCFNCKKEINNIGPAFHVTAASEGISYVYHCCSLECSNRGEEEMKKKVEDRNKKVSTKRKANTK